MALICNELIRDLHELIAALDRRVPQVERAGKASIARDAAALKVKTLKRIAELEDHDSLQSIRLSAHAEETNGEMNRGEG
jgi:hypothetical protein